MAKVVIFKANGMVQSIVADGLPAGTKVAVIDYDKRRTFHSPEDIADFERQQIGQSSEELMAAGAAELYTGQGDLRAMMEALAQDVLSKCKYQVAKNRDLDNINLDYFVSRALGLFEDDAAPVERTKTVSYAYPSSDNAEQFGFGKVGCYVVSLGPADHGTPHSSIAGFATKGEAFAAADKMPEPFDRYCCARDEDCIVATAASFWAVVSERFPEMKSGDSQLSGEDEAALAIWLVGDPGDRPVHEPECLLTVPSWVRSERIGGAIADGMAAARTTWLQSGGQLPQEPSAEVVAQLDACVRHVLHWNLPDKKPVSPASMPAL